MHVFSPRNLPKLLRAFALVVLSLGFVSQPMLAAAGEIHELGHGSSDNHVIADHVDHVPAPAPADEPAGDDATQLHGMLHFAHCCGQVPAVFLPVAIASPPDTESTRPAVGHAASVPDTLRPPLLRPPISA